MMIKTENSPVLTIAVIVVTFLVASMLNVYPLSADLAIYRPMVLITTLLFWTMFQPKYIGLSIAFFIGIASDLLLDTVLGQQAFCALVATFMVRLASKSMKRVTFLTSWIVAAGCLTVFQLCLWILQYITQSIFLIQSGWSLVTSILLWPIFSFLLQKFR